MMTEKPDTLLYKLPWLLFIAMLFLSPMSHAAELKAYVDRNIVQMGQFIQFSLTLSDKSSSSSPDFSILEKDFEILSSVSRGSQTQIINGRMSSSTSWSITITPRREGAVVIPPFELAGLKSEAITVVVGKAPEKQHSDAYFESQLSSKRVYVQAQLRLDLKLYIRMADISDSQLEPLNVDNAKVIRLGEPQQSQIVNNGIRYYLIEQTYFIYPERSGRLEIPAINYSAIVNEGSRYSRYGTRRRISTASDSFTVEVLGIPDSYPKNAAWLPAEQVMLAESFSDDKTLQAGEPVTRSIVTKAVGLQASALPPARMPEIDGLKVYPDQGSTDDRMTQQAIIGTRKDSFAIIANKSGDLQLPDYKIPWWDTQNNTLRYASLEGKTLTVEGSTAGLPDTAATLVQEATQQRGSNTLENINTLNQSSLGKVLLAFALLWLGTVAGFLWYISKMKLNSRLDQDSNKGDVQEKKNPNEKTAFEKLGKICKQGNTAEARQQLLDWAVRYYPDTHFSGLTELGNKIDEPEIFKYFKQIDACLYQAHGSAGSAPELDTMFALLSKWRKAQNKQIEKKRKGRTLAELYPR